MTNTDLTTEDWLKAMKIVDPYGHDKRYLETMAERYQVPFEEFLDAIQGALTNPAYSGPHRWVWAAMNSTTLMDSFDRYRDTHPF